MLSSGDYSDDSDPAKRRLYPLKALLELQQPWVTGPGKWDFAEIEVGVNFTAVMGAEMPLF